MIFKLYLIFFVIYLRVGFIFLKNKIIIYILSIIYKLDGSQSLFLLKKTTTQNIFKADFNYYNFYSSYFFSFYIAQFHISPLNQKKKYEKNLLFNNYSFIYNNNSVCVFLIRYYLKTF